jgi:hypothetical protein
MSRAARHACPDVDGGPQLVQLEGRGTTGLVRLENSTLSTQWASWR